MANFVKIRSYLIVMMPLALGACGIPDLVAHGVKTFEKSQEQPDDKTKVKAWPDQPVQNQTVPQTQPVQRDEPPVSLPGPSRDSVTVEPLR